MFYNLKAREKKILKYLIDQKDMVSGSKLANVLSVTERTVHSDIKSINLFLKQNDLDSYFRIVSYHSKGYQMEINDSKQFEDFCNNIDISESAEERILSRFTQREISLLIGFTNNLSMLELQNLIYFGETATRNLIKKINVDTFRKRNITIEVHDGCLNYQGKEYQIRAFLLGTLLIDVSLESYPQEVVQRISNPDFIAKANKIVIETVTKYRDTIAISQEAINYIVQILWVFAVRNQLGHYVDLYSTNETWMIDRYNEEIRLAEEIINKCRQSFLYEFTNADLKLLTAIVVSIDRRKNARKEDLSPTVQQYIDTFSPIIIDDFQIQQPEKKEELLSGLVDYFYGFEMRRQYNIRRNDFGVTRVKRKLFAACAYSRKFGRLMKDYFNIDLDATEKTFFSISIAKAVSYPLHPKYNVLVAGKYGIADAEMMAESLKQVYSSYVNKVDCCETYEVKNWIKQYDMVITDFKPLLEQYPNAYRSHSWQDAFNIEKKAADLFVGKQEDYFTSHIHEDSVILCQDYSDNISALKYIGKALGKDKNESKAITKKIVEWEEKESFEIGNSQAVIVIIDDSLKDFDIHFFVSDFSFLWYTRKTQIVEVIRAKNFQILSRINDQIVRLTWNYHLKSKFLSNPSAKTLLEIITK